MISHSNPHYRLDLLGFSNTIIFRILTFPIIFMDMAVLLSHEAGK